MCFFAIPDLTCPARTPQRAVGRRRLALLDLDGVLADDRHRVRYALQRDWATYFALMERDAVWPRGRELYDACVYADWDYAYLTGRREDYRQVSRRWLKRAGFSRKVELLMRPSADRRPLCELKAAVVAELLTRYAQVILYDDDPAVIEAVAAVPGARAHHCTWYVKPQRMVKRATT